LANNAFGILKPPFEFFVLNLQKEMRIRWSIPYDGKYISMQYVVSYLRFWWRWAGHDEIWRLHSRRIHFSAFLQA
jgi:hypothetical protein